ncbi:carbohydrate kinase family protein [Kaarinaea lacus]
MSNIKSPIIFGEVLYDCFPDGRQVLGGAPFNVAWHCQAFGMHPVFISRVGKDDLGEKIQEAMRMWGMDTRGLQVDNAHPTGKVEVTIIDDEPSYEIVPNSAWDFIDGDQLPALDNSLLIYHGSLILRNKVSQDALQRLREKIDVPVFVDINLREPWWELSTIRGLIKNCDWLKLNEAELACITPGFQTLDERISSLRSDNPLEKLIVTRGELGAFVKDAESTPVNVAPEMNTKVVDTVGAGDAFSSIILVGYYYDWSLPITLERAQAFASAIVGIRGATTSDASFYQPFLEKWQLVS